MPPTTASPKAPARRRFTVEEYYRMADAGILPEEKNRELLDGHIYLTSPIGSQHASCVNRLTRLFVRGVEDDASVRVRSPIRLSNTSEPEPDLALLAPRHDDYKTRHPGPDDIYLIVDVAFRD